MKHVLACAIEELADVAAALDQSQFDAACARIATARRIMLHGCGREGLMMRALAMRLHHLGLAVSTQGDMTAPPLGQGDLFFCSAGPGDLSTVTALMRVARIADAEVLVVTAEPSNVPPGLANDLLVIPAQTMARDRGGASVLPMGSLFEGGMFLVFEAMVLDLALRLGETAETMRARHTNME